MGGHRWMRCDAIIFQRHHDTSQSRGQGLPTYRNRNRNRKPKTKPTIQLPTPRTTRTDEHTHIPSSSGPDLPPTDLSTFQTKPLMRPPYRCISLLISPSLLLIKLSYIGSMFRKLFFLVVVQFSNNNGARVGCWKRSLETSSTSISWGVGLSFSVVFGCLVWKTWLLMR
ncbi:hypothetical protein BO82DRAFT_158188 [Aspergillus uvarum CBS 121591]|uniref:Transmembrane protein n=1 Tax=Aspergillus uvarum CBS 121591 TaxID=1448315 RepID=A0A319C3A7_9EURO|nr:hypothetical protein BO82DRAFT_158188 [Aspergillus uvarum CBS 121591]PYH78340.1 hypothetical protein BO82DRAFT_158188 [Aspergillus uvarum CBS 121591]